MKIEMNEDFSLVLSGGGALGIAQLPIIKELEKQNIIPKEIIGTSMGGIIGACMSIGMNYSQMYDLIEYFSNAFKWIKLSMKGNSIVKAKKLENIFYEIFVDIRMNETKIPLKIVTTDLKTGKAKVFTKKDEIYVRDAVLATMAIPGVFEEKHIKGKVYVDGFLTDNLGLRFSDYENIIAIDSLGENAFTDELPNNFFKTPNVLEMVEKSMRLLILNQTRKNQELIKEKNVLLFDLNTKDFKTYQFNKYKEIIHSIREQYNIN